MPGRGGPAEEIKRLYFAATRATIAQDLERAIELLISLESDEAREQVAVYMDGLAQMRSEWAATGGADPAARDAPRRRPPHRAESAPRGPRGRGKETLG